MFIILCYLYYVYKYRLFYCVLKEIFKGSTILATSFNTGSSRLPGINIDFEVSPSVFLKFNITHVSSGTFLNMAKASEDIDPEGISVLDLKVTLTLGVFSTFSTS